MKAIFIAFLLFASLFFLPTSTMARQLKEGSVQTGALKKNAVTCSPGKGYRKCVPSRAPTPPTSPAPTPPTSPAPPCSLYTRQC
ncbi:hypothetical protein LR48_Vigan03g170100 [Vigna angularis]|uniref:Uncharacterized protein n=2 Tax=Phaseolus angularis TaxID=3914 RepID=A0A0L9U797_PHAAN|nr:uncharacterized protein HKW66_Vig0044180 [Vigna angularis]KOM38319.1 hypothetical protein LR48_Vigan03g170100 [Vigna angularis]BAT84717.1 hypothetical protein VIGAN_04215800 [Vigna angularis var. angularis]